MDSNKNNNRCRDNSINIKKKKIRSVLSHICIYLIILIVIFPFIWMILASFKTQVQIMSLDKIFIFSPTLRNYSQVFNKYEFIKPITNSFIIAVFSTLFSLMLGLPASYAIAKYKQSLFSTIILIVRIIPGLIFLVPWFIIFSKFRMIDTYSALILTHMLVSLPFIVWTMTPYFESIPKSLEEAAYIDGSSQLYAFTVIILPLCRPGILTASILSCVFSWNNFMFALVLTGSRVKTLPIAVYSFVSYADINWGGLMAAAVVITAPILIISLFLQRYIIAGLTSGSVKG